ncbi:hypothetical protein ALI22I_38050 [Saccharothrix sp. ALI-22-I]|uniref:hypothetical protein n=1 Tax=Saccharothrix sp. ALI-22-I TaxID=1933778 RepID=UPI00097BB866|nr:hypothetical protein [Saccharothrix sp. ALI-22-I]ONI81981.1 hypothetical protein ALI22I_38050 [Saccharothrix sp. ALI-22-I]
MSTPIHSSIRTPDDIPHQPLSELVEHWSSARLRTFVATHIEASTPTADDLFAELAYGTRIAQETTSGRWCVVADLLRTRNATSWPEIGAAMAMTGLEAKAGFHEWVVRQTRLRTTTGILGLTNAEATALHLLAEEVSW